MSSTPGIVAAFGAGMFSFLSPCVLPLVPGYLSMLSGVQVNDLQEGATTQQRTRTAQAVLGFVVGFTIVFCALGATASALGQWLLRNQRLFEQIAGAMIIVFGLFLAGFLNLMTLQRERRFHLMPARFGIVGPPLMGMAFAFGWTPCIGPVLAPILALASTNNTLTKGVALLLAYSMGLAVPFIASGLALDRLTGSFAWIKRHYRVINLVAGGILIVFGLLLLTNELGRVSTFLIDTLDSMGLHRLTRV